MLFSAFGCDAASFGRAARFGPRCRGVLMLTFGEGLDVALRGVLLFAILDGALRGVLAFDAVSDGGAT